MERLALQTGEKYEPLRVFCIEHLETPVERKRETTVSNKSPLFLLFKRKIVNPCLVQYWKTWRRDEYSIVFLVPDCVALLHRLWSSHHVLLCPVGYFSLDSSYLPFPVRWNPTDHKGFSPRLQLASLWHASSFLYIICVMFLGLVSDPRSLWRTVSACRLSTWQSRRWNLAEWEGRMEELSLPFFNQDMKIYWRNETLNRFLSPNAVIKIIPVLSSAEKSSRNRRFR